VTKQRISVVLFIVHHRKRTESLREFECFRKILTHHTIRMVQEALLPPPNSNHDMKDQNLTGLPLTGIWLTQSQTKEMSTAIGMLSVLLFCWLQATLQVPRFVYRRLQENWQNTISNLVLLVVRGQVTLIVIWKLTTIQAIQGRLGLSTLTLVFSKRYKCVHNVS
jgi:hypothetical protein